MWASWGSFSALGTMLRVLSPEGWAVSLLVPLGPRAGSRRAAAGTPCAPQTEPALDRETW